MKNNILHTVHTVLNSTNRFYIVLPLYALALLWCLFCCNNPYTNAFVAFGGMVCLVVVSAWIGETANEKEVKFMERLENLLKDN